MEVTTAVIDYWQIAAIAAACLYGTFTGMFIGMTIERKLTARRMERYGMHDPSVCHLWNNE